MEGLAGGSQEVWQPNRAGRGDSGAADRLSGASGNAQTTAEKMNQLEERAETALAP